MNYIKPKVFYKKFTPSMRTFLRIMRSFDGNMYLIVQKQNSIVKYAYHTTKAIKLITN